MKGRDGRLCFYEMVDFPKRKRPSRGPWVVLTLWEPLERKKEKTKCSYSPGQKNYLRLRRCFLPKKEPFSPEDLYSVASQIVLQIKLQIKLHRKLHRELHPKLY